MKYHAHVYFDSQKRGIAENLRRSAEVELPNVDVSPLLDKNVGPHTSSMFEIEFKGDDLCTVTDWLDRNRLDLDILIHPLWNDEVAAHTEGAVWLGNQRDLDPAGFNPSKA